MFLCVTGFHVEVVGQILLGSTFQDQGSFNEFFPRESSASPNHSESEFATAAIIRIEPCLKSGELQKTLQVSG